MEKVKVCSVEVVGISPLLQSRFTDYAELAGDEATRPVVAERQLTRRDVAEEATYMDTDKTYYHPGPSILRLLREAGSFHKLKGNRKSVKFIVPSAVIVLTDRMTLLDPRNNFEPLAQFEVDSRSVVNQTTKGRIMSHRPRWDHWALRFDVEITTLLTEAFVQQLLQEGGRQLGLGAFRPEKGGPFGRFRVTNWKTAIFDMEEDAAAAE